MQRIRFRALLSIAVFIAYVTSSQTQAQGVPPPAVDATAELKVASISATASAPKTHLQPHQAVITPQTAEPIPAAGAPEDHRLVILFFDLSWLRTQDVERARESAQKYIDTLTGPADTAAVVTYSTTFSVIQDFTSDRQKLHEAIDSVALQNARGNESGLDAREMGQRMGTLLALTKAFTPILDEKGMFSIHSSLALLRTSDPSQLRGVIVAVRPADFSISRVDVTVK
jgi:hypothetical protein